MEGREGIECGVEKEDCPLHSYGKLIDHPGEGLFDDVDVWGSRRPVSNINKLIGLPRWTFVILCFVAGALLTPQELVTLIKLYFPLLDSRGHWRADFSLKEKPGEILVEMWSGTNETTVQA